MRKAFLKFFILILFILFSQNSLSSNTIKVEKNNISIDMDKFALSLNPFTYKLNTECFEGGKVKTKGILSVLYNPFFYDWDNQDKGLGIGNIENFTLKFKLNNHALLISKQPRNAISYSYQSKYFSLLEALFLDKKMNDDLIVKKSDNNYCFSRLFMTIKSFYVSAFVNLDYNINLGLYSVIGFKLQFSDYNIAYIFGDCLKGFSINKLNHLISFGLNNQKLSFQFAYTFEKMPIFLDQFRAMGFEFKIKIKLKNIVLERNGKISFSENGKYSQSEGYKIITKHIELIDGKCIYIKIHNLKFGLENGYSVLNGEWKIGDERTLGFNLIFFKQYSLYFKIHL